MQTNLTIEDVEELIDERLGEYKKEIDSLKSELEELSKQQYSDNESPTRKVNVHDREISHFGSGYLASVTQRPSSNQDALIIGVGPSRDEQLDKKYQLTKNSAITIVNRGKDVAISYIAGESGDSILNLTGNASISGNVITDKSLNLEVNELSNLTTRKYSCFVQSIDETYFNVFQVTSNTKNTITLSDTPDISGNLKYGVLSHVYLGVNIQPFQRIYTREGEDGGIRFGIGPTGQGGNGLLYLHEDGRLRFRRPNGDVDIIT